MSAPLKWSPESRPGMSRSLPAANISTMTEMPPPACGNLPSAVSCRRAKMKCFTSVMGASKLVIKASTTLFRLDSPRRSRRAPTLGM